LTKREPSTTKVVLNGAGAAGIACIKLIHGYGVPKSNIIMCDTKGVIFKGRTEGMNQWKEEFAAETESRTLKEALVGADCFIGVSAPNVLDRHDVAKMAAGPLIFAMANPVPEISPAEAREGCPTAIIATGRSDYPNQINNVMCFPFLFRGALDTRATDINLPMKLAAANALANLAREEVPFEVVAAYQGREMKFGNEYIMPTPFDPRLLSRISSAVAKAAMDSGVAKKQITDWVEYEHHLKMLTHKTSYWDA